MHLQPSSGQRELIAIARRLAREHFTLRAERHDREASFPFDDYADLRADGLLGLCVPERYGGLGADFAEIGLEAWGVFVPGREDDARIGRDPRLDEAEGRLVERVVIGFALAGNVFERAVVAIGPAVIGTQKNRLALPSSQRTTRLPR
jgi:acyl-CoA dehydrogenase-like protein